MCQFLDGRQSFHIQRCTNFCHILNLYLYTLHRIKTDNAKLSYIDTFINIPQLLKHRHKNARTCLAIGTDNTCINQAKAYIKSVFYWPFFTTSICFLSLETTRNLLKKFVVIYIFCHMIINLNALLTWHLCDFCAYKLCWHLESLEVISVDPLMSFIPWQIVCENKISTNVNTYLLSLQRYRQYPASAKM